MAHLSVENVLIFLRHCYVEVFDFSLPPFSLLRLFSPSPSRFLSPSSFPFFLLLLLLLLRDGAGGGGGSCSGATVCLSAFRFELAQHKQVLHEV